MIKCILHSYSSYQYDSGIGKKLGAQRKMDR